MTGHLVFDRARKIKNFTTEEELKEVLSHRPYFFDSLRLLRVGNVVVRSDEEYKIEIVASNLIYYTSIVIGCGPCLKGALFSARYWLLDQDFYHTKEELLEAFPSNPEVIRELTK